MTILLPESNSPVAEIPPLFFLFCSSHPEVQIIINCQLQTFFDQMSYCDEKVQMAEWELN